MRGATVASPSAVSPPLLPCLHFFLHSDCTWLFFLILKKPNSTWLPPTLRRLTPSSSSCPLNATLSPSSLSLLASPYPARRLTALPSHSFTIVPLFLTPLSPHPACLVPKLASPLPISGCSAHRLLTVLLSPHPAHPLLTRPALCLPCSSAPSACVWKVPQKRGP
jgi:hypothetical protein